MTHDTPSPLPLPLPQESRVWVENRLGLRLAALLKQDIATSHDVDERLRVAREQALQCARAARRAAACTSVVPATLAGGAAGRSATLGLGGGWGWRLASALPLAMLVGGVLLIDRVYEHASVQTAADVDVALLSDDLPPAAYGDAGFVEFLKNQRVPQE